MYVNALGNYPHFFGGGGSQKISPGIFFFYHIMKIVPNRSEYRAKWWFFLYRLVPHHYVGIFLFIMNYEWFFFVMWCDVSYYYVYILCIFFYVFWYLITVLFLNVHKAICHINKIALLSFVPVLWESLSEDS